MNIVSDNNTATEIIRCQAELVVRAGGFVNPELNFHFGVTAEKGMLSLSGIPSSELALRIPTKFYLNPASIKWTKSLWRKLYVLAGYQMNYDFWKERTFDGWIVPLADMVNHDPNCHGRIDMYGEGTALYGSTVDYGCGDYFERSST